MPHLNSDILIPLQIIGAQSDIVAEKKLPDEKMAKSFFKKVCQRLLNVNKWRNFTGNFSGNFRLCDKNGNETERPLQIFDHFKIDTPGQGEGYNWVRVEVFEKYQAPGEELMLVRVRPVNNPDNSKKEALHFFTDNATDTFIVKRIHKEVSVEVHGRNEKGIDNAETVTDKARNLLAGTAAAIGLSGCHWKSLADGLITT